MGDLDFTSSKPVPEYVTEMAYRTMWEIEVRHEGLKRRRQIRGPDRDLVEKKALAQKRVWEEIWSKGQESDDEIKMDKELGLSQDEKVLIAHRRTKEARKEIELLTNILVRATETSFNEIDRQPVDEIQSFTEKMPAEPPLAQIPPPPARESAEYQPEFSIADRFIRSRRQRKMEAAQKNFDIDKAIWAQMKRRMESENARAISDYKISLEEWNARKISFEMAQENANKTMAKGKSVMLKMDQNEILDYCDLVLAKSTYPDYFPRAWEIEYMSEQQLIILDYALPAQSDLPRTKAMEYLASSDEFVEARLSGKEFEELYDSVLYQISLRTIHELFASDSEVGIKRVMFNGWIESVNKATGIKSKSCKVSVSVARKDFELINLELVDPKACFEHLHGVSTAGSNGLGIFSPVNWADQSERRVSGLDNTDDLVSRGRQEYATEETS